MDITTMKYAAVMLTAGVGIPVLAALNAQLGLRLGNPAAAAFMLFIVALAGAAVVLALTGPAALAGIAAAPRHLFLAGLLVAFYVLSITWIAPKFGIGNAVFFVLLGQLVSAAAIDHFGLMGVRPEPIGLTRAAGLALMALGVFVTQRA